MPIRVAVVEDDSRTLARIRDAVASEASLEFVYGATRAVELIAWFTANPVDVLLVDLGLPDLSGLEVLRRCRDLQPGCSMMVLTIFGDEASMLSAFEAGAVGYLLKDGSERDLAHHVRQLQAGGSPMSPVIARRLVQKFFGAGRRMAAPNGPLSPRESEILGLVAKGFAYLEIAAQLGLALTTVHTHVRGIYRKLGVHNRSEAVFEARELGLLR